MSSKSGEFRFLFSLQLLPFHQVAAGQEKVVAVESGIPHLHLTTIVVESCDGIWCSLNLATKTFFRHNFIAVFWLV
jgi:hypothetical protein